MFGQRILILIPHPDDEVVGCCASIGRARAEGAEIFGLYLTTGCIAQENLWPWQRKNHDLMVARRRIEAEKAAKLLGLKPIGFSLRPTRSVIHDLADCFAEIRDAIVRYDIDQLWGPAYEGGHADHDAVNFLGGLLREHISVIEFAEYTFVGGRANSNAFPRASNKDQMIRLTPEEQGRKCEALGVYLSERKNLGHIGLAHESFRPLPAHDYSKPPHTGRLWYARFQWVPFKHPRIDFTKPADVCCALSSFAQANALPAPATQSSPAHKG